MESGMEVKSTKELIFETGVKLFSQFGYNGASIRDIVKEVGIKGSSFYNHFESKEKLLEEIITYFVTDMQENSPTIERLNALLDQFPPEKLLQHLVLIYINYTDNPLKRDIWNVVSMMQYIHPRAMESIAEETERGLQVYENLFRLMIERGLIKDLDPRHLAQLHAYASHALHLEFFVARAAGKPVDDIRNKIETTVDLFYQLIKI